MSIAAVTALLPTVFAGCLRRGMPVDTSIERTTATAGAAAESHSALRVVTFNVHGEPADVVARAIRDDPALRRADAIMLQEVHRVEAKDQAWCSTACGVAKELGFHAVFAPGHAIPEGSHGVAIISRAPITSAQVIELPFFDVHFNAGRRVALAATVEHDGEPITLYAVHLDNRVNVRERRRQMTPVLMHAARQDTPIIMAGDFNTSPFTWIAHVIPVLTTTQDNRFEELLRDHGFATPVTESGPTHVAIGMRLDAIYTRGFDTLRFAVSNADYISDHLALWAEMQLARPRVAAASALSPLQP